MRRPTDLEVDTVATATEKHELYELTQSPSQSTIDLKRRSSLNLPSDSTLNVPAASETYAPPPPSIALLFSFLARRDLLLFVLPAVFTSILAGGIAPFMTRVVGQQFDVFSHFPLSNATDADKRALLHGVGLCALQLVGLAVGALLLSSVTSSLWICAGERNAQNVRQRVFDAVSRKDMVWFDTKMGAEGNVQSVEGDGPLGAGGLMSKFARETDEVRTASSLASGWLLQYLTTTLASLAMAFQRSWSLTLVILSAVPAILIIQGVSQALANPPLAVERAQTATAATLVDRAIAAIATVKAFNAQAHERAALGVALDRMRRAARRCNAVWGATSGLSQFAAFAMFIQGFWYGAGLVRSGRASAGDVMAVFWACLIATSNLQMCIPQFIVLAKGKFAMAALVATAEERAPAPGPGKRRAGNALRKIVPARCEGELVLQNVTFAYPSRPDARVLDDVSVYLPAGEMTFVVGGSGSGKSTIAQLLLRLYAPGGGQVLLDEQDTGFLDEAWMRRHVACVSQTCILFDKTVHENVALGLAGPGSARRPEDATRTEVENACRAGLMHEFIRDLPDGYDTVLGTNGASLSGGQKQRLAIARAMLRNPTILILDEATSALDATSRVLVFEAIKHWRRNMTTIVITHDLSQIASDDFLYVLKNGHVAEQGFRGDLESDPFSTFREMADSQGALGGFPVKDLDAASTEDDVDALLDIVEDGWVEVNRPFSIMPGKRQTLVPTGRPSTLGNWMFDAVAELSKPTSAAAPAPGTLAAREANRLSRFVPMDAFALKTPVQDPLPRRRSIDLLPSPVSAVRSAAARRLSLQFTPTTPTFPRTPMVEDDIEFQREKDTMAASGAEANRRRVPRERLGHAPFSELQSVKIDAPAEPTQEAHQLGFWRLVRDVYPTVPYKPAIALGILICLVSGAMTPLFSFVLSRVMYEVSIGGKNVGVINMYGAIVLAVTAFDGLLIGLKFYVMETAAMAWVTRIRHICFERVLAQDKKWFDKSENSPVRLVQILIKDGDDARSLISTVLAQLIVVTTMLAVGLIWALVRGWQLTLVGFAIAPVFAVTMAMQTKLVSKCEFRNKRAKEDVAKVYYETISNIRGIRSMGFEGVFQAEFDKSAKKAHAAGVRGAFIEGATYGVSSALIYLAEALLFYVSAILVSRGTYTYLQMIEVLNLVVFTVTLGSQLMTFTERIAKSVQATNDFNRLLQLPVDSNESRGIFRPKIGGTVAFKDVCFSYPERPDVQVLTNLSMELRDGECVAIVGSSGSGKSTVASLLQRLYEPASGTITIGGHEIRATDVHHLREHVAVVSQNPNLFDATIAENIAYGAGALASSDVERAARAAHAHDFITTLPSGYDTMVGENAALISGGQAQRIQIARALARPARVLILDECTSALDGANQAAVMETIQRAKVGRTTLMVTHKLPVMQMCDRIVVIADGRVAEEGTYENLVAKKGVFAQLARGGEWDI